MGFWSEKGLEDGTVIRRHGSIQDRKFTYALHAASYERIYQMISALSFAETGINNIKGSSKSGVITFTGVYAAQFTHMGMQGDLDQWCFKFTHFRSGRGADPSQLHYMNVLLTAIEKGLLEIDPLTTVLEQHHSMKTHSNFF